MLRHILTAAAVPTVSVSTSSRIPSGPKVSAKRRLPGPPSNIGTWWPYGLTGAITAASTNVAPTSPTMAAICCFNAGETEFRSA
jgi:hypothetical protein